MVRRLLLGSFFVATIAVACGDSDSGSAPSEDTSDAATTDATSADGTAPDGASSDSGAGGDVVAADDAPSEAASDAAGDAGADAEDADVDAGPIVTTTHANGLAANMDMACVITTAGEVKCWGGFTDPTVVTSSGTWKSVAPSGFIPQPRCAIRSDDTLWCWSNGGAAAPVQVSGTFQSVSTFGTDACAITSAGALECWGNNNVFGQLGQGDTTARATPTQVGTDLDWKRVVITTGHTCALKTTGAVYCWGWDGFGQVGDGTNDAGAPSPTSPVAIDAAHTYVDLAASNIASCAIRSDGALVCWGSGLTLAPALSPTVIDAATDWKKVRVGRSHACALKGTGELHCWGANERGQLGLPVAAGTTYYATPQRIGTDADWVDLALGDAFTCATKLDGAVRCWGARADGRLGYDGPAQLSPRRVGSAGEFTNVGAGPYNTCAVRANGQLACWGTAGPLPSAIGQQTPLTIGTDTDWKTAKPGYVGACATKTNDALYCWATGGSPSSVSLTVEAYDVGYFHQCAIASGSLYCWGDNTFGKLGTSGAHPTPTKVGTDTWKALAVDFDSTCAVKSDGTLYCFGFGATGIEKQGTATTWSAVDGTPGGQQYYGLQGSNLYWWNYNTPIASGSENDWTQIAAGSMHVCGIRAGGTLWCKGDNSYGQLGNGTTTSSTNAVVQVGSATDWVQIAAGTFHTCGRRATGDLYCWGSNDFGEQGDGKSYTSSVVVVP